MEQLPSLLLCAVIGYLLGSVSAGILYSHLLGSDIRRHGSKNPGASNMLRIYGMNAGTITFIFDCAKAIGAVLLVLVLVINLAARLAKTKLKQKQ